MSSPSLSVSVRPRRRPVSLLDTVVVLVVLGLLVGLVASTWAKLSVVRSPANPGTPTSAQIR